MNLSSISPEWQEKLQTKLPENYWKDMQKKIDDAYLAKECTPSKNQILRVYETLNPNDVRAVLLGQDPYPKKGYATGLAFASSNSIGVVPQSLAKIFQACNTPNRRNVELQDWIDRGVFLLNTSLTTEVGKSGVHKDIGWNPLTRATLRVLSETQNNVHFILMGVKAQKYRGCIDAQKNIVSHTFHPQARGLKHKFIDGFNAIPNNPLLGNTK